MPSKIESAAMKKLEEVRDPELGISIIDLGLIYKLKEKDGIVYIKMTLTSFGCPLFSILEGDIKNKIAEIKGVKEVKIELTFDPPWSPDKMTEKGKSLLGISK